MIGDRRIVVCGSMKSFAVMARVGASLASAGVSAVLPDPDGCASVDERVKREASRAHMCRIADPATWAVLLVNPDRAGAASYVGPNALAEAAVAFFHDRAIFLLHAMPDNYADELSAWGAVCLRGDLQRLIGVPVG